MTQRLYYADSFLYEFDAAIARVIEAPSSDGRSALVLDRTAFYPTSGGQVFDTGKIFADGQELRVTEVAEAEDGAVLHFLESPQRGLVAGATVRGLIDRERRIDHMQQHSGQHLLSATFVRLFDLPTVSFHMGVESCSIDLDAKALSSAQIEAAEKMANEVVRENRSVTIRFVTQEEARALGLRKLPSAERDQLRLIEIDNFDLSACGGTHASGTAQIGAVQLRKVEKVRQGVRVEFVCGERARKTSRRDFDTLTEAAALLSAHLWDVPQQVRKSIDQAKSGRKEVEKLQEELAAMEAARILQETPSSGTFKIIVKVLADCDTNYIKLLAQKLVRQDTPAIALLAGCVEPATMVFAQSAGLPYDMGVLMKEVLARAGGRGGGSKDMAQGGPAQISDIATVLAAIAERLRAGSQSA